MVIMPLITTAHLTYLTTYLLFIFKLITSLTAQGIVVLSVSCFTEETFEIFVAESKLKKLI